jgi:hypothetical protein
VAEKKKDETQRPDRSSVDGWARPRKERVLHTRIPALLDAELRAAADSLRVPVSNLVRTILEDALSAADRASESVEVGLERAARTVQVEGEKLAEQLERGLSRAAGTVHDERGRIAERVEQGLTRAARAVHEEGERLAGRVEDTLHQATRGLRRRASRAEPAQPGGDPFERVVAFQPVIVATRVRCTACDRTLEPGEDAGLAISDDPTDRRFVCQPCVSARSRPAPEPEKEESEHGAR